MPRVTKTNADPSLDSGFAALEAKVEEVQLDAAAGAEIGVDDSSTAPLMSAEAEDGANPSSLEPPQEAQSITAENLAPGDFPSPVAWLQAYAGWAQDGVRLHIEAMSKFAAVRGPQDLLAAQRSYFTELLDHSLSGASRLAQASPARMAG